jgi:hypothetical protein
MNKKWACFSLLSLLGCSMWAGPVSSQSFSVEECVSFSTGRHKIGSVWTESRAGVTYSCRCDAKQGLVCTPASAFQSPSAPFGKGLSPSKQLAAGLMANFFNSIFADVFSELTAPPDTSYLENLKKQQAAELKKQQEMKKEALERWLNLQAEEEARRRSEETAKKKAGEKILAETGIGGGGLKMEPIGGGKLTPFSWDAPRNLNPAPSGRFETSKFTEMKRLLCGAYFSKMAEQTANSGDLENARFYGSQMDNVMQGQPTAVECKPPEDLTTGTDLKKAGDLNQRYTRIATLFKEITPKIEKLQELEIKLEGVVKTKQESEQKVKELDRQIEEIKAESQPTDSPEKKAQDDDLLTQAESLKSEAEKQYQEAVDSEENLTKEKQSIEDELKAMKDKMQEGDLIRSSFLMGRV